MDKRYRFSGKGPGGKNLCRWCGTEVAGRRRNWCSDECVEEFRMLYDWNHIRYHVKKRDKGVCAVCKTDTIMLEQQFGELRRIFKCRSFSIKQALGISSHRYELWDADHILARVDGGTNEMSNLRTLCIWCHKHVTKQLAQRRARERKKQCDKNMIEENQ